MANRFPFFVDVGFGNTFNSDKVVGVQRAGTSTADRILTNAKEKHVVYDCRMNHTLKSIFVLESGDVVLSHLSLETARKRLNIGSADEECRYTEVVTIEPPVIFKEPPSPRDKEEDIFDGDDEYASNDEEINNLYD